MSLNISISIKTGIEIEQFQNRLDPILPWSIVKRFLSIFFFVQQNHCCLETCHQKMVNRSTGMEEVRLERRGRIHMSWHRPRRLSVWPSRDNQTIQSRAAKWVVGFVTISERFQLGLKGVLNIRRKLAFNYNFEIQFWPPFHSKYSNATYDTSVTCSQY